MSSLVIREGKMEDPMTATGVAIGGKRIKRCFTVSFWYGLEADKKGKDQWTIRHPGFVFSGIGF